MLNGQQFYLFGQIQTSQTGGQPCGQCSLPNLVTLLASLISVHKHLLKVTLTFCFRASELGSIYCEVGVTLWAYRI